MKKFIETMQMMVPYMKNPERPNITCEHDVLIIQQIDFNKMTRDIMADFADRGFFPGNPFDGMIEAQDHLDHYAVRDIYNEDGSCFTEEDFKEICKECYDSMYSHRYGSC